MPANKKYLSTTGQRILKISAAFIGGYLVTLSFHLFLMTFLNKKAVIVTGFFSIFIIWCVLMMLAFLSKNGWKIWGWYLLLTILFSLPYVCARF
ncbi:MAG: hypothetical protein QM640_02745 [Niabella sp.]